jgi:hypothetical protein
MKARDASYITDRGVDTHLWVVVSEPTKDPERVILVSVTTYEEYKEDVCLLDVGDHPRVSHKSCIAYNEARVASLEKLTVLRDGGLLSEQESVSNELLFESGTESANQKRSNINSSKF